MISKYADTMRISGVVELGLSLEGILEVIKDIHIGIVSVFGWAGIRATNQVNLALWGDDRSVPDGDLEVYVEGYFVESVNASASTLFKIQDVELLAVVLEEMKPFLIALSVEGVVGEHNWTFLANILDI